MDTPPAASVTSIVTTIGGGVINGNAETLVGVAFCPNKALYVLFASPDDTMPPREAGTDVLSAYGGVVNVGVDRTKLGRAVGTVAVLAAKKDEMSSEVSTIFVVFCKGYNPIKGGSLPLIP